MTEVQIREAFPEARVNPYPRNSVNHFFGLYRITIGHLPITYRVDFIFESGGLDSVKISFTDTKDIRHRQYQSSAGAPREVRRADLSKGGRQSPLPRANNVCYHKQ